MPILPKSYVNFAQKSVLFYRSVNFIFGKKIVPQGILTPVRPSFFCLFLYYFPFFTNSAFICHAASASPFSPHPRLSFCTQVRRNKRKILPPFTPKGKPLPCRKTGLSSSLSQKKAKQCFEICPLHGIAPPPQLLQAEASIVLCIILCIFPRTFLSAKTSNRIPQARLSFTLVADTDPVLHKR